MLPLLAAVGSSVGKAAQQNAAGLQGGARQQQESPTSGFVAAARQAALERQQAQAAQVQTTPTALAATQGGAMTQTGAAVPVGQGMVQVPTMQNQGVLSLPPGGLVSQGTADPEILAAMYRGY